MAVSTIDALSNGTSEKLTTSATGITVTGNATFADNGKAIFGAGSDLQIYHDGSNSYVKDNGTGDLYLQGTANVRITNTSGQKMFLGQDGGEAQLYHNGSQKLATTSTGIDVTGTVTSDGLTVTQSGSTTATIGATGASGDNDGTLIINNGGTGDGMLRFDYQHLTDRARIGVSASSQNLQFYTAGNNERMRIDSSGNLLVGKTSTGFPGSDGVELLSEGKVKAGLNNAASLLLNRGSSNGPCAAFFRSGSEVGQISVTTGGTSYNTSSDYRLKENVVDLTGASERVNQLNPSRFNFIADTDTTVDGFLAHEVATVVPEAITGTKDAMKDEEYEVTPAVEATYDEDGNELTAAVEAVMGTRSVPDYQGIDQSKLVPLLTAALQEALTEIASLKTRVEALEA